MSKVLGVCIDGHLTDRICTGWPFFFLPDPKICISLEFDDQPVQLTKIHGIVESLPCNPLQLCLVRFHHRFDMGKVGGDVHDAAVVLEVVVEGSYDVLGPPYSLSLKSLYTAGRTCPFL